jgi:hypothetical protein
MSDLDLKSVGLTHWWQALVAAGLAIVVASVAVKFVPTILIGLGILLFGIGSGEAIRAKFGSNMDSRSPGIRAYRPSSVSPATVPGWS